MFTRSNQKQASLIFKTDDAIIINDQTNIHRNSAANSASHFVVGCIGVLAIWLCLSLPVQASEHSADVQTAHFNLTEQPLASALITFSRQAGMQVIIASPIDSTLTIPAITGTYRPLDLLAELLSNSELIFEISGDQTIIIRKRRPQTKPGKIKTLEEILVTARKRYQKPSDISVALTVFDRQAIEKSGLVRPEQLALQVPSMTVKSPYASSNPVFAIRGVGYNSFTANMSSTIGFYIDDFYLNGSSQLTIDLYDIERIEVLRGPQGTLFGRNTLGGAVSVVTRRPGLAFDAYLDVSVGDYQYAAIQGAIGGAISDTLAARVSFSSRRQEEGFYENRLTHRDHGELDISSWRFALEFTPSDSFNAYLKLYGNSDRSEQWHYQVFGTQDPNQTSQDLNIGTAFKQPCQAWLQDDFDLLKTTCVNIKGYRDNDGDPYSGLFSLDPIIRSDTNGAVLHSHWDLGFAELQTVTGYELYEKRLQEEFDGSPFILGDNTLNNDIRSVSQELRLVSKPSDSLEWILGAIYTHEQVDSSVLTAGRDRWGTDLLVEYQQGTANNAIFAHVEWALNSAWQLIAGARYSYDRIDFDATTENLDTYNNGTVSVFNVTVDPGLITAADNSIRYGAWSGKLGLDYKINPQWLWYSHISRAYKSGGYTGYWAILPSDSAPYSEETLTAYETGVKWQRPQWNLTASSAIYFYDYRDLQQIASTPSGTFLIGNIGDIDTKGIEAELRWAPLEQLKLITGFSYIDASYKDKQNNSNQDFSDNVPVNTPEWAMNTAIEFRWPLASGFVLTSNIDASYQSKVYMSVNNRETESQDAYWLYNGRISLSKASQPWEVYIWGKNLSDETYATEAFSSASSGSLMRAIGSPRTLGLGVTLNW